jgi:Glycoside hydrolase 123, catalytic domain/Glycoside hydrolase 123 N-terminal domain
MNERVGLLKRELGCLVVAAMLCLLPGPMTDRAAGADDTAPQPVQVWNSDALEVVVPSVLKPGSNPLGPISIVATRNGAFSGQVVVGSAGPIRDLKADVSDLKGSAGSLPASRTLVRYATAWEESMPRSRYKPMALDILLDSPPAEIPVVKGRGSAAAVVAVWVTVKVPKEATPGTYTGTLTLRARGLEATGVPVTLKVVDWTLPAPQDYRTWVELIQSPDTLAMEYKVPLWSEEHWKLIARSMQFLNEVGSRVVHVPLISYTNFGNAESMVRWIAKDDGTFDYDFSIMDRYLDVATRHMGRPKIVVFTAWDIYLVPGGGLWTDDWWSKLSEKQKKNSYFSSLKKRGDLRRSIHAEHGNGPPVTVLDPSTKDTATVYLLPFADPSSKALWKPLFEKLTERMSQRGLKDTMMLGMISDASPSKDEKAVLGEVSGGLPWVSHSHFCKFIRARDKTAARAAFGYEAFVWDLRYAPDPTKERPYGWKRKELLVDFDRFNFNSFLPTTLRHFAEFNITGHQRGVGRLGGDRWWAIRDKRGRRVGTVAGRYPQSMWRNVDLRSFILAPGPEGAVATTRYEIFREGIQECEARIAIERVLTDEAAKKKLGAELADRCQTMLDERLRLAWKGAGGEADDIKGKSWRYKLHPDAHKWYLTSGWQQRTETLFALAGEVAKKAGGQ